MEYIKQKINKSSNYKSNIEPISNYIENPIEIIEKEDKIAIYGNKCNGCRSCGGGCYGCKVTPDMLEAKLKDAA